MQIHSQLVPVPNRLAEHEYPEHTFDAAQEKSLRASGSSFCKPFGPERHFLALHATRLCGLNNPLYQNRYRRLAAKATREDKRLPVVEKRKTNSLEWSGGVESRHAGTAGGVTTTLHPRDGTTSGQSCDSGSSAPPAPIQGCGFPFCFGCSFPCSAKEGELRGWFSSRFRFSFYLSSKPKKQRAIPKAKTDPSQLRLMEEAGTYGTRLCTKCKTNPVYMPWIRTMTECEACLWKALQEENL